MSGGRAAAIVRVALGYLAHRRFASWVSAGAIGLSLVFVVAIGLATFAVKRTAVEGAIAYPLVVGPEGASSVQLVLSTIFHIDKPTGTIPASVLERLAADERVLAAYPLAVADSLESYPIIGTTAAFLENLGVGAAAGSLALEGAGAAVLGSEAADRTELTVGDTFHGTHGMVGDEEAHSHDELTYRVVGVLAPTSGPQDAAVFVAHESVWEIHHGHGDEHHGEKDKYQLEEGALTAVLVRTASPVYTAQLEREWTLAEGTQAVDTGRTVRRLVSYMNKGERLVELFAGLSLAVAVALILVVLVMSLNERRRELALMRSLGVGRGTIALVVMCETSVITLGGCVLGLFFGHGGVWWAEHLIKQSLGVTVEPWMVTSLELTGLGITLVAGQLLALAGMLITYRMNLVEEIARD